MSPPTPPHSSRPLTWLITGASSGLGLSLARLLLSHSHNVIATSRNPGRTPSLVAEITSSPHGRWLALDVTSPQATIDAVIAEAWSLFEGGVDVLVNNAAYCVVGAVEDVEVEQVGRMFETNFLGVLRVQRAVLGRMRGREMGGGGSGERGCVVNVSSALGVSTWPSCGLYGASKFAVEGMSQALYHEVKPFGIRVLLVELGAFRTNFLGSTAMQAVEPSAAYVGGPVDEELKKLHTENGKQPGDPEKAMRVLFDVVVGKGWAEAKTGYMRLPLGEDSLRSGLEQAKMVTENFEAFREAALNCGFDE